MAFAARKHWTGTSTGQKGISRKWWDGEGQIDDTSQRAANTMADFRTGTSMHGISHQDEQ